MSNQVIIQNAVKRYGDFTALNGVSLDIQEGEFFTLLGPSGCGKTTLLRMIAGFNSIEGGDFYFGEKRINDVPAHKRDIGMVFQNYAIFPHLTVRENVAYGLKARKMPAKEIKPKVDEALELVQISHLADRKPNELSGGQQQRVALARVAQNSSSVRYAAAENTTPSSWIRRPTGAAPAARYGSSSRTFGLSCHCVRACCRMIRCL